MWGCLRSGITYQVWSLDNSWLHNEPHIYGQLYSMTSTTSTKKHKLLTGLVAGTICISSKCVGVPFPIIQWISFDTLENSRNRKQEESWVQIDSQQKELIDLATQQRQKNGTPFAIIHLVCIGEESGIMTNSVAPFSFPTKFPRSS